MFLNPYSANRGRLNGSALYAVDRGEQNFRLMDAYPGRTPYIQRTSVPPIGEVPNDHPQTPRITLTPIRVKSRARVGLRTRPSTASPLIRAEHGCMPRAPGGGVFVAPNR